MMVCSTIYSRRTSRSRLWWIRGRSRNARPRYWARNSHELPLIVPGMKYNRGAGLRMALEVGTCTAGSFDGMLSELVDSRAGKLGAVIWGHNCEPTKGDTSTRLPVLMVAPRWHIC